MKCKTKIKVWIYRPDYDKVKPEYLFYKGKSAKTIKEETRLVKLCQVLKQILIDY